ncbi:MAG: SLC13 family permease [Deltaproteobacteria bacterium]|nr:SLC13 family permease [Deltaproteobacteria bacterium]MBW2051085.1 SLC13 family permease [Deltaproteobacteria bacterium]MBW2140310.1 SLC13 family permease [Deltaproteobacteria bacterium]MBW2322899.1 SLC13 family permease [Deltaproteobacteria bacterium]
MEELKLTTEMIMVMGMIGVAIFLFVVEWVRVDVVAILMMVSLPLLKLVKPEEAFIGLSSNAVVSIIAVIIIGAGLDRTGLINRLVSPILRLAGQNPSRIMIFISATVAIISSFMQNIGAAALFLPAIQRISKQTRVPLSRLLMPIGFCAILGGTITLVGSSPLILLNDLIKPFNLKPFSLFSVTPIGLALVASGILYFIVFGRFVLPKHHEEDKAGAEGGLFSEAYARLGRPHELKVPNPFNADLTMQMMRDQYLVHLVGLARQHSGDKNFAPERETRVEAGDSLAVIGPDSNVHRLAGEYGFTVKHDLDVFKEDMSPSRSGMVEAVVAPRSHLVGKTMRQVFFRKMYQVNPLAIYRADKTFYAGLSDIVLKPGDTILLHGTWDRFHILKEHKEFLLSTPVETEVLRPEKALLAGFWLAVALVMVMVFKIQLSVCLMTGALGMIITRVLSIDEAYQSVDWRTIFLLGGLIPLGIATMKSGTAAYIANLTLSLLGPVSPLTLLVVIAVISTVFTLVVSNVGATVLLVPLVVNMALQANMDPRMAVLVVGLATSNSFILPTHQVNALYMGPGRYRSVDFIKVGSLMSVIFIFVMIGVIYLIYGIT